MFLIWRGWGIVVVPIVFIALILAVISGEALAPLGLPGNWSQAIPMGIASILAAALIWFLARSIGGRPSKRLVDPASGQQYIIRRDAGSLFFIPTRFWAFIILALGLLMTMGLAANMVPPSSAPVSSVETQ